MKRTSAERARAVAAKRPTSTKHADLDVVIVRRAATPQRRARLVRLLAMLLDKSGTPEEGR